MEKGTQILSKKLLSKLPTTVALKSVSQSLESLAQNTSFKNHASSIVADPHLSDSQKKTQLLYLIRSVNEPVLYDFFADELSQENYWLFTFDKIDYFDKFVQTFQQATETLKVIHLVTAINLETHEIEDIGKRLAQYFGFSVVINLEVNPAIIGGLQARLDNVVFDLSLRSKFHSFEHNWVKSLESLEENVGRNQPPLPTA